MKYKAIIFDMDGTIITTESVWEETTKQLLKAKGNLSEQECQIILPMMKGASLYATCAFIKETFNTKESVEELIAEKERLAFGRFTTEAQLIPGFDRFHNKAQSLGLKTAIATNANQRSVDRIMKHLPLDQFFNNHIYSIDIVNRMYKPYPDIYLHAAAQLDTDPKHCLAIEDSAHGVTAAKAAGMFCIGINTGKDRNAIAHADHIIEGYDELDIETLLNQ